MKGIQQHYDVLFTVSTLYEIRRVNIEISKIGPKAFVVMSKINGTRGGMFMKRNLK